MEHLERQFLSILEMGFSLPAVEGAMFGLWTMIVLGVMGLAQHDIRQAQYLAARLHRSISHLERGLEGIVPAQILLEEATDVANSAWNEGPEGGGAE